MVRRSCPHSLPVDSLRPIETNRDLLLANGILAANALANVLFGAVVGAGTEDAFLLLQSLGNVDQLCPKQNHLKPITCGEKR